MKLKNKQNNNKMREYKEIVGKFKQFRMNQKIGNKNTYNQRLKLKIMSPRELESNNQKIRIVN